MVTFNKKKIKNPFFIYFNKCISREHICRCMFLPLNLETVLLFIFHSTLILMKNLPKTRVFSYRIKCEYVYRDRGFWPIAVYFTIFEAFTVNICRPFHSNIVVLQTKIKPGFKKILQNKIKKKLLIITHLSCVLKIIMS